MLSLGQIEVVGLPAAIEAADVALKAANVELIGYEATDGMGMVAVKIVGQVGAVKAAIAAAEVAAARISKVFSVSVIPRPNDQIEPVVYTAVTVGRPKPASSAVEPVETPAPPPVEPVETPPTQVSTSSTDEAVVSTSSTDEAAPPPVEAVVSTSSTDEAAPPAVEPVETPAQVAASSTDDQAEGQQSTPKKRPRPPRAKATRVRSQQ